MLRFVSCWQVVRQRLSHEKIHTGEELFARIMEEAAVVVRGFSNNINVHMKGNMECNLK